MISSNHTLLQTLPLSWKGTFLAIFLVGIFYLSKDILTQKEASLRQEYEQLLQAQKAAQKPTPRTNAKSQITTSKAQFKRLHLQGIAYQNPCTWCFWLNGQKIDPHHPPKGLTVQKVTPNTVTVGLTEKNGAKFVTLKVGEIQKPLVKTQSFKP